MERPKVKRQKVMLACTPCRSRKVKCDGCQPVCAPCRKRGVGESCVWDTAALHAFRQLPLGPLMPTSNATFSQSSHTLTRENKHGVPGEMLPPVRGNACRPTDLPTSGSDLANSSTSGRPDDIYIIRASPNPDSTIGSLVDEFSGVHAVIGASPDDYRGEGFFGSSCAGKFMQRVRKMVEEKHSSKPYNSPPDAPEPFRNIPLLAARGGDTGKSLEYTLPARRIADGLLTTYWNHVQPFYPFLDQNQVQEWYEQLWTGGTISNDRSFLCLINAVFALSSQLDQSTAPIERKEKAAMFCSRAHEMFHLLEKASVRSVMIYLLLALYYQSTNGTHSCWLFAGLGIRTAQSLGLHLPGTSENIPDRRTREIVRRVWHGCVLMDRTIAMMYGRPCMVGPRIIYLNPMPNPLETDQQLVKEGPQKCSHPNPPSLIDFFVCSQKLYVILHDVIFNSCYTDATEKPFDETIGDNYLIPALLCEGGYSILDLEQRLSIWMEGIPEHLNIASSHSACCQGCIFQRQAIVLHQRHLHVKLCSLRPVLSNFITAEYYRGNQPIPLTRLLSRGISLQCAIVCTKVAQEAIATVWGQKTPGVAVVEKASPWWENVLYLYSSATVLISARLSSAVLEAITEDGILDSWSKVVTLLEEYGVLGSSVRRLVTTLRLLFDTLPSPYSRPKEPLGASQAANEFAVDRRRTDQSFSSVARVMSVEGTSVHTESSDFVEREMDESTLKSAPYDGLTDFQTLFDPDDLSWLMTVPFDS